MEECINGVLAFNEVAGNFIGVNKGKLLSQLRVIQEEVNEVGDAITKEEGNTQILKEAVDLAVTVHGLLGMLSTLGFNVEDAWNKVNKNNMTKFCDDSVEAAYTKDAYASGGVEVDIEYNEPFNKWVIRDKNGKVRKKLGYDKCSVWEFAPIVPIK